MDPRRPVGSDPLWPCSLDRCPCLTTQSRARPHSEILALPFSAVVPGSAGVAKGRADRTWSLWWFATAAAWAFPGLAAPVSHGRVCPSRASSTSSWAAASRCCTHACVRTAGSSWRGSPGCTSCTCSRSGAGCTPTPSQVGGGLGRRVTRRRGPVPGGPGLFLTFRDVLNDEGTRSSPRLHFGPRASSCFPWSGAHRGCRAGVCERGSFLRDHTRCSCFGNASGTVSLTSAHRAL